MSSKKVAVIGAGPAGIAAVKNFVDLGFEVVGFDRCDGPGGNWRFDDPSGHSSVFETTHIISSKENSEYEDYPLPKDASDYPSHTELFEYFTNYAKHFNLLPHYRFATEVVHCEPLADDRWKVEWKQRDTDDVVAEEFDALVVCNGHHHTPRFPDYPGEFTGEYIHSHSYKRAAPFKNKRVLVIGGGNSACDVSVETSRISKQTVISWRRGYYLVPKFMFGKPSDMLLKRGWYWPMFWQKMNAKFWLTVLQGKNEDIGLPAPDHEIFESHPTMNSELYYMVRHGKVKPKGDIERFDGKIVHFKDGTAMGFDTVIACTGFKITHPFFNKDVFDFSESAPRLYHKMIPDTYKNVYFVGLFQPLGCIWPGAELQAKLAARHLAGLWQPDGDLSELIDRELQKPDLKQVKSGRHTITVMDESFRRRLKKELKRALPFLNKVA